MFDIKITGGLIVDGTGRKAYLADLGIVGDKISAIGDLSHADAKETIDATGKMVAPGFIDMHTHSDFSFFYDNKANAKLFSGVTTEVIGNCGIGAAPTNDAKRQLLKEYLGTRLVGSMPVKLELPWDTLAEYNAKLAAAHPCLNIAVLSAQGPIRIAVKGFEQGPANAAQIAEMQSLVRDCMDAGAVGMSSGLVYMPGAYTEKEEVAELCKAMKPYDGIYTTHMRTESYEILKAIDEALWIGKTADCPVEISHLKLMCQPMHGKTDLVLEKFAKADAEGMEVHFDIYPYVWGWTSLGACMPPWVFEGGTAKLLERLHDKSIRERVKHDIAEGVPGWQNFVKSAGGWDKFYVSTVNKEENKPFEGKFMTEVGEMQGKDPNDAAFDLLISENGRVQMNFLGMSEDDVITFLKEPRGMICSDSMSLNTQGILNYGKPNPRAFGSPTRFLGHYVRDLGIVSWEEGIRKMTGLVARKCRLNLRGELKPGYYADITVFDPETVNEMATNENPQQYSVGVEHVIVNGEITLKNRVQQDATAGRIVGH